MPVTITGLEPLFRKLGNAAAVHTLEPPMHRGVLRLQSYMQVYPPPPAGSKYVRSGTLGKRWTAKVDTSANGLVGRVGNRTAYGPFVQSNMFQTPWHRRTGWHTDSDAVRANEDVILADFQQAVDRALAG
jgi:hypothetical protein